MMTTGGVALIRLWAGIWVRFTYHQLHFAATRLPHHQLQQQEVRRSDCVILMVHSLPVRSPWPIQAQAVLPGLPVVDFELMGSAQLMPGVWEWGGKTPAFFADATEGALLSTSVEVDLHGVSCGSCAGCQLDVLGGQGPGSHRLGCQRSAEAALPSAGSPAANTWTGSPGAGQLSELWFLLRPRLWPSAEGGQPGMWVQGCERKSIIEAGPEEVLPRGRSCEIFNTRMTQIHGKVYPKHSKKGQEQSCMYTLMAALKAYLHAIKHATEFLLADETNLE
ncbi:hypothetical protein EI555_008531 [Monodon monoceros]|uniref:Uncharacterized protein n=1 Tax=Monodon monoceros TaxID=40151 RepID=A0A4V5P8G9_MONMO|nr:hypothetical protein EI555_008531 [Monodon monoceros]